MPPITPAGSYELWPDNVDAFSAFSGLRTQWQTDQNGLWRGLDYAAVVAQLAMDCDDVAARRALFADIKTMEAAAIPAQNELQIEELERQHAEARAKTKS